MTERQIVGIKWNQDAAVVTLVCKHVIEFAPEFRSRPGALILCSQCDSQRSYFVIHPATFGVLGSVSLNTSSRKDVYGWWFISNTSSHSNGRRPWSTAEQAVPRWAKKMGAELS